MLYQTEIMYRGHLVKISKLKPNSLKKIKIHCGNCNTHFNRQFSILQRTGNLLCQKCSMQNSLSKKLEIGFSVNNLTVIETMRNKGYSLFLCDCGNEKVLENTVVFSGHTKSCGCLKVKAMRNVQRLQKKEKHPNWKGGKSSENLLLRTSKEYKRWRTKVFERDNYKCLKCGKKGGVLNAHHIKEFSVHRDIIFDVNNGATLCEHCHKKFHNIYGRTNLKKSMLEKFNTE